MHCEPQLVSSIKVIDFNVFTGETGQQERQSVADELLASFKTTGFVYLVNHGLSKEKIDTMFDWSKRFFALPSDIKQLAPHPKSGTHHRGYSAPGVEKVSQHLYDSNELAQNRAKAPDVKESFECGREGDEVMPNIWLPDDVLPGFKEACLDFFWAFFEIEKTILKALALGFNLPEEYFLKSHTKPDNQLRLLHYPSIPIVSLKTNKISRIDGHSDFGTITLLLQDDVGGLEVEDPNRAGEFIPVVPVPGTIVVNAGDLLSRWSNDTILSTVHRVRAPLNGTQSDDNMVPDRYSIPYFCSVDREFVVDCLPGTYSEHHPKKYEAISAREYVMKRLAASY